MASANKSNKNIVILISGSGSNMAAIARCGQGRLARQVGRAGGGRHQQPGRRPGLELAQSLGIATAVVPHKAFDSREAFDAELMARIDAHAPALVVLAGFMRILTPGFVQHYAGRLINIHPSLLPAFTGLNTHQRAMTLAARWRAHGA
jgi:phosphoribosylglycinamide formyltransferase-1